MGNGIDICFPAMNAALRHRIAASGLLLSEYEDGMRGTRYTFPARNRIISGLCSATIVVEAGIHSGALITAGHAVAQGRDVYAIPGNINRKLSAGCNKLIRDGAFPLIFLDGILDDLGLRVRVDVPVGKSAGEAAGGRAGRTTESLGENEAIVLGAACESGGITVDEAAQRTGLTAPAVASAVTLLEIKGFATFQNGRITPIEA
jgi:DNA processing protein